MPLLVQCQVRVIQKMQKTVEVRQVQFIDKVVDVPVAWPTPVPLVQYIDRIVDVPVVKQHQVPIQTE